MNLILSYDGGLKITDFGGSHVEASMGNETMCSKKYMSTHHESFNACTDVYAAGYIIWEILNNRLVSNIFVNGPQLGAGGLETLSRVMLEPIDESRVTSERVVEIVSSFSF
jgi:serine/threonine protein kinase